MAEQLPDSGGAYFDEDNGGILGVAKRNFGKAKASITSGDMGVSALAFAVGGVVSYMVNKRIN